MDETQPPLSDQVRFGRTVMVAMMGDLVTQSVEALIVPANARGIMGAGMIGAVRFAGGLAVERAAMGQAPLPLGGAILTESGQLADQGIRVIVHAVVSRVLGEPAREEIVRRATSAAMRLVEDQRVRSVALPLLGSGTGPGQLPSSLIAPVLVEEIIAHLRRTGSRIERIVFVSRAESDIELVSDAILLGREHIWEQL